MDDTELQEMFRRAFGDEPAPPLIDPTVRAGRAALRRRRVAVGVAGACAAGIAFLGATHLPGSPSALPDQVDQPTSGPSGSAEAELTRSTRIDASWRQDCGHPGQEPCDVYAADAAPVGIDPDGSLTRTSRDVVIIKKAVDPTPPAGTTRIEAEVRTPERTLASWYVVTRETDGSLTVRIADPQRSLISFADWARSVNDGVQVDGAPALGGVRLLLH